MNGTTFQPTRNSLIGLLLLAAVLGALLAIPVVWAAGAVGDAVGEPDSFEGTSDEIGESEANLLDAVHTAAESAVAFEGGKYLGETFEITKIELTAENPHITAYRVVIERTG